MCISLTKGFVEEEVVVEEPCRERRRHEKNREPVLRKSVSRDGLDVSNEVFWTLVLSARNDLNCS